MWRFIVRAGLLVGLLFTMNQWLSAAYRKPSPVVKIRVKIRQDVERCIRAWYAALPPDQRAAIPGGLCVRHLGWSNDFTLAHFVRLDHRGVTLDSYQVIVLDDGTVKHKETYGPGPPQDCRVALPTTEPIAAKP